MQRRKQPSVTLFLKPGADNLRRAYDEFLKHLPVSREHIAKTPVRVVNSLLELTSGYNVNAEDVLRTRFSPGTYNQLISVNKISFSSLCLHHVLPFHGFISFAYIPNRHIVGLSKIPRLVETFSHRLQIQESLAEDLVNTFQKIVRPKGCAVLIEARHECMSMRGVRQQTGYMRTVALRGLFLKDATAKAEFLSGADKDGSVL